MNPWHFIRDAYLHIRTKVRAHHTRSLMKRMRVEQKGRTGFYADDYRKISDEIRRIHGGKRF